MFLIMKFWELRKRQSRDQDGFSIVDEHELIQYVNLSDVLDILSRYSGELGSSFSVYFKKSMPELKSIVPIRNRVMHARPLHFDDYGRVADLAKHLVRGRTNFWTSLRRTLIEISADSNAVSRLTIRSFDEPDTRILNNLPLPDFDDTGFIGRAPQVEETKEQILGSYPVVSIIAEGGYGKTALALKICYDLLDSADCPFEAIVWTTAKASKLTPIEIVSIDNAITDSLGIFAAASSVIARNKGADPLDDLLRNLAAFPVLLIIDNLETVLDENVDRLVRRIPRGSKILFTSRASMGAFHFPIKLLPFEPREAQHYFRVTSRVWGLEDYAKLPSAAVTDYCRRLQHSPLFIKWFIQAVRTGQRPEAILANPKLILPLRLKQGEVLSS
jgi:hypothetical protein